MNRRDIDRGLTEIGLASGDVVEVHSSLGSLGHVRGGAATVVDALLAAVGPDGAVVMSAYPVSRALPVTEEDRARGVSWKVRVLPDGSDEGTSMGAVVDEFLRRPGIVLGEGVHRVAAWGRDAERHAARGYRELADRDGSALLIGVGIDRCSSLHLADGVPLPKALEAHFTVPEEVRRAYPAGVLIGYHEPPESPWDKARDEMDERGLIRKVGIGRADCMRFRVRPMLAAIEALLESDPFGAFGLGELGYTS